MVPWDLTDIDGEDIPFSSVTLFFALLSQLSSSSLTITFEDTFREPGSLFNHVAKTRIFLIIWEHFGDDYKIIKLIMTISNLIRIYVPNWNLSLTTWRYVYKWFQIWGRPNSPWQLQFIFPRPWWGFLRMRLICVFARAAIFCYQYLICLLQRWNYSNLYVFWGDQNMVWNL